MEVVLRGQHESLPDSRATARRVAIEFPFINEFAHRQQAWARVRFEEERFVSGVVCNSGNQLRFHHQR